MGQEFWLFRQRGGQQTTEEVEEVEPETIAEPSEAILDAIVALDDLHASGDLPEAAYQERRSELKTRLAEALEREKRNS